MAGETQDLDYLSMSDEEIANMVGPQANQTNVVAEDEPDEPDTSDIQEETTGTDSEDKDQDTDAEDKEEETSEDDDAVDPGTGSEESESEDKTEQKPVEKAPEVKEVPPEEKKEVTAENKPNFEAEYNRLLAPFKANGRDIKVNSVDEAITLMQMGANYNKKMAGLKPNLKLMKLLENNNLLSEEKISFLIDLDKKNPAAINKLVKDSGIDPMDFDADKASAYKQTAYTVDDREIELDTVLGELQDSPAYNRTLDIVSTKWDAASKHVIAGTPQLLKVINDHVSTGIYDVISKEVENERMFGRLTGLSDIEAYRKVGDALHAKGAFNSLAQGSSQTQQKQQPETVVVTPKPKPDDAKLKEKRRAASSTKPGVAPSGKVDFDPLAMSDDEFAKLVNKKFL